MITDETLEKVIGALYEAHDKLHIFYLNFQQSPDKRAAKHARDKVKKALDEINKVDEPEETSEDDKVNGIHPGEILREEFMKPLELSAYKLANDIGVPVNRITEIVKERRAISPDTAIRLSAYFQNSSTFWMNLQNTYDIIQLTKNHDYTVIKKCDLLDHNNCYNQEGG